MPLYVRSGYVLALGKAQPRKSRTWVQRRRGAMSSAVECNHMVGGGGGRMCKEALCLKPAQQCHSRQKLGKGTSTRSAVWRAVSAAMEHIWHTHSRCWGMAACYCYYCWYYCCYYLLLLLSYYYHHLRSEGACRARSCMVNSRLRTRLGTVQHSAAQSKGQGDAQWTSAQRCTESRSLGHIYT